MCVSLCKLCLHDICRFRAAEIQLENGLLLMYFNGFRMDHGFQVLLTAYPGARRWLDYKKLDLQEFSPGALLLLPDGKRDLIGSDIIIKTCGFHRVISLAQRSHQFLPLTHLESTHTTTIYASTARISVHGLGAVTGSGTSEIVLVRGLAGLIRSNWRVSTDCMELTRLLTIIDTQGTEIGVLSTIHLIVCSVSLF